MKTFHFHIEIKVISQMAYMGVEIIDEVIELTMFFFLSPDEPS
jgi:hypothetical protein